MLFMEMGVNHSQLTVSKDGNRNGKRLPFCKETCEGKTQRNFPLTLERKFCGINSALHVLVLSNKIFCSAMK